MVFMLVFGNLLNTSVTVYAEDGPDPEPTPTEISDPSQEEVLEPVEEPQEEVPPEEETPPVEETVLSKIETVEMFTTRIKNKSKVYYVVGTGQSGEYTAGRELPVGVITSVLGGPFFLYLLKKSRSKTMM